MFWIYWSLVLFLKASVTIIIQTIEKNTKKGNALEVSKAVTNYAPNKLKFLYLIAVCNTLNEESKKVCERLKTEEIEGKVIHRNRTTFCRINIYLTGKNVKE